MAVMKSLPSSLALLAFSSSNIRLREQNLFHACPRLDAPLSPSIIDPIIQHPSIPKLSIDTRPRRKLKAKHKYLFTTCANNDKNRTKIDHRVALFNELALIACETGVVPRKELFETYSAAVYIHEKFSHMRRMADLAAGHGLLSWFLLVLDYKDPDATRLHSKELEYANESRSRPRTVICVDRRMPSSAEIIAAVMIQKYPELESRWTYVQSDLSSVVPHSSCLITSVHACGTLTDYLIELAIGDPSSGNGSTMNVGARVPLAVVPCCHTVKARKGYGPHLLSGMKVEDVVALVKERKKNGRQGHSKGMAMADVLDDVRLQTLENAGYDVEEVMLPEIFTAKNRLILGELKDESSLTRADDRSMSGDFERYGKNIFERRPPHTETIQIPLSDDEESISQCHAISGKERSNTRLLQQIPKHFSPSLVISIWLDNSHLNGYFDSSIKLDRSVSLGALQALANQCCKLFTTDEIECNVEILGDVYVQPETGRRSQRYQFMYKKPKGTDITKACVSREAAKAVDKDMRDQIVAKFGDILR